MSDSKLQIYHWEGIHWDIANGYRGKFAIPLCPKDNCSSRLKKVNEDSFNQRFEYHCSYCDFSITLNKQINELGERFLEKIKYKEAEIINLDGELIPMQRVKTKDDDYWANVRITRNKKGELQLMVLAGSRKTNEKVQLFLDPTNERLAFDQNNDHPTKIFSKVIAIFKNSNVTIEEDKSNQGKV